MVIQPFAGFQRLKAAFVFDWKADRLPRFDREHFAVLDHDHAVDHHIRDASHRGPVLSNLETGVVRNGFRVKNGEIGNLANMDPPSLLHGLETGITQMLSGPVTWI